MVWSNVIRTPLISTLLDEAGRATVGVATTGALRLTVFSMASKVGAKAVLPPRGVIASTR